LAATVFKAGTVELRVAAGVGAALLATVATSCSSSHSTQAKSDAETLVSAARAAGVAPGLTVGVAESLYGTSADQVCDALDGGVSSTEQFLLTGNPAGRRPKVITTDAITYGRLVVKTYCPDQLATYDDLVTDIDGVTRTG
jgi:hypothetical protein